MTDRVVLYHPDNALSGLAFAQEHGLEDYAYASAYMPLTEIWITTDPKVIAAYDAVLRVQRAFGEVLF